MGRHSNGKHTAAACFRIRSAEIVILSLPVRSNLSSTHTRILISHPFCSSALMSFPALPAREQPWSPQVYDSVQVLRDMHRVASEMLAQGNYDVSRILYHADSVASGAVPLLFDLEAAAESEELPQTWIQACAEAFHNLLQQLCEAENAAQGV